MADEIRAARHKGQRGSGVGQRKGPCGDQRRGGKHMAEENESMEMISFGIVASAGQARSLAMEAIKTAREGDVAAARKL
ncbi:PTS lactose/cellobiose transporter subunit IIA, partial [Collinsella intestinalis]|uniref:PTS lactose/cellobiose transporter subunit IIA n=1 Tax=Collinsella intestinalis TaxID=147207 RepID=UPI003D160137